MILRRFLALAALMVVGLGHGQTVQNPGFQTPALSTGQSQTNPTTGDTFWQGTNSWGIANGVTVWGQGGHNSSQYAFLQSASSQAASMFQNVSGFTIGNKYRVRFWMARRSAGSPQVGNPLLVRAGGTEVFSSTLPTDDGIWNQFLTRTFTARASTLQLLFQGKTAGTTENVTSLVDDVSAEQVNFQAGFVGQNTTGSIGLWRVTNGQVSSWTGLGVPGSGAKIVAVGDFNGDGHTDLMGQYGDDQIAVWLMTNNSVTGYYRLGSPGTVRVFGAADVNNDGFADFFGQNRFTNEIGVWFVTGASVIGFANLGSPGSGWTMNGVGDFNRDGWPDLIGERTDGVVALWYLQGTTVSSWKSLGSPGLGINIVGVADFDGNGHADFLGVYEANNFLAIWYTDGQQVIDWKLLGSPGTGTTIGNGAMFSTG